MRWRYVLLPITSLLVSLEAKQVVLATEAKTNTLSQKTELSQNLANDFWLQAQEVVQEQIYLINRIENTLRNSPDLNRVEAMRGQLTLHLGKVEYFLKSQYRIPAFLCPSERINDSSELDSNLTEEQIQVYCSLYVSLQQLPTLGTLLERRLPKVSDLTDSNPLLTNSREAINYRVPAPARISAPNLPTAEPPLIGKRVKTPIANYLPPLQPAIAISEPAVATLATFKQLLAKTVATFPSSFSFTNPTETTQAVERYAYTPYPQEPELYASFLARPLTGIALLLPAEVYRPKLNGLRNRLEPTLAERFPFAPLLTGEKGFTPRLAIQINNGNFQISQPDLDYGLIADLGEVPLEDINPDLKNIRSLSVLTRELLLNYRPPTQIKALQADRRRLTTGKLGNFTVQELGFTQAPAVLNHTYLLRLIQFQVPEVVLKGGLISRSDRQYLDHILSISSSDILLAFRPVSRRRDGSYTVLWRLLTKNSNPQITDLDKYTEVE